MNEATALQIEHNFLTEWTPESLTIAIEREKQLRVLVIDYCKSSMEEGHDFYNLPGQNGVKPALSKEGALNICSLFKFTPTSDEVVETFHEDDHYTVRARCNIVDRGGVIVATGDGICTSRESKYAYRWVWDNEIPPNLAKETLKKKEWTGNGGRTNTKYQLPNQDLPDIYNTILKMSAKRAMVDAVLRLPLVSKLFTQDLGEQLKDNVQKKQSETHSRNNRAKTGGESENVPPTMTPNEKVKRVVEIADKLQKEHGVDLEDLVTQFLPEGVAAFADLLEDDASEILPSLVALLNANIKKPSDA